MIDLTGKAATTVGVANEGSIACGAARACAGSRIHQLDEFKAPSIKVAPMGRLVTIEEVGATAAFLASDAARAITVPVICVDCGRHIMA